MHLKKLKFAGFKSFVDPTTVTFPGEIVAVVGPNGCGKSNIIDAVRWVMGESSAKQLRGESLDDVVFNGSSTRKPVGQASVELVFDNKDGSVGGEYAAYNEICIKRVHVREGQSQYYLNNTRCRRKDITGIFLGTGLGPRSYSVIEQGMISQLVEAKPEEFRVFLEEAAGISKYKERRRETENRIRHTMENLDRLSDLREELGKNIEKLQRQAKAAERYRELREEERLLKAQLYVLRWQELADELSKQDGLLKEQEVLLESYIADQTRAEKEIEQQRQVYHELQDQFNEVQTKYYQHETDIARLEEAIQHQRERREQLQQDLTVARQELETAQSHAQHDQSGLTELQQDIDILVPELDTATAHAEEQQQRLNAIEQQRNEWQQEWDAFNQAAAESAKLVQVEQTRIQHLEQRAESLQEMLQRLEQEQFEHDFAALEQELTMLEQRQHEINTEREQQEQILKFTLEQLQRQRIENTDYEKELDQAKDELQHLRGRYASLEVLQQAALGQENEAVSDWLIENNLSDKPRLAQTMQVTDGWETAVETVLDSYLQAITVDDLHSVTDILQSFPAGDLVIVDQFAPVTFGTQNSTETLLDKVTTDCPTIRGLLANVYTADSLSEALSRVNQLRQHESIITQEGIHIGPGWLKVACDEDSQAGILKRQQQLKQLELSIEKQTTHVSQLQQQLETGEVRYSELESQKEDQQASLTDINNQKANQSANAQVKRERLQQLKERASAIAAETQTLHEQLRQCENDLTAARNVWHQAMQAMDNDADLRETLLSQRDNINTQFNEMQQRNKVSWEIVHEKKIRIQAAKTQFNSLEQSLERINAQVKQLTQRSEGIALAIQQIDSPESNLQQELQEKLAEHSILDEKVKGARSKLEEVEVSMQALEEKRSQADQSARALQGKLEQLRMDAQTLKVKQSTIVEQLQETQYALDEIVADMPEDAVKSDWEEELEKIGRRIQRLGAINLAAIDEFKTESERKAYLDEQCADLTEALTTLQNAIRKIDKETRARFRDTYDNVNKSFQTLFPTLFGGGNAYLELTGDDLLDTGVAVIARPPGKRNSSIHLLSGGEKALTAIALVFAIFQLNPSPFCMLDEVDAPLDDANVGRFCNLVKEMSKKVQFIVITHNKLTMEAASHLSGVTMHEPGVSRIVSVDVDEAVSLAEA